MLAAIDSVVGTFARSVAGIGGFAVSNHDALPLLHFNSRPYVFSASGSPSTIAAIGEALEILRTDSQRRREQLWANIRRVRAGLVALGFAINATESPIVSIEIGPGELAIATWRALLEAGL